MDTAKLFTNGRSQAVRIPLKYRFEGDKVYIKRTSKGILLIPLDQSVWDEWEKNFSNFDDDLTIERDQPKYQERKGLDEVFA